MRAVVPAFDHALRVLQDEVFLLHHAVRGQATLRLSDAHAAARCREAHADAAGGLDAVVQPYAVGIDVEVVAAGGTTTQQQLGHRHLRAHPDHLRRQPGPDRVQTTEPTEQFGVLHPRHGARQVLRHVVVRVDQPWRDQMVARINHLVRVLRQVGAGTDGFDQIATNEERGITQLARALRLGVVEGGKAVGVLDQQRRHEAKA